MISFEEKIRLGLPLSEITVIDCHNHIGKWNAFYIPENGSAENMVHVMDRVGIDRVFVTAHAAIGPDYRYGNDIVLHATDAYPDRIMGYVTINPNYPGDMRSEIDRCFEHKGIRGIKLHPVLHGRPIDFEEYAPAYEYANSRALPVLIHVWGANDVAQVANVAQKYPDARLIMGHFGANTNGFLDAIKLINKSKNVYGDTAISSAPEGNIEFLVSETDPRKILFGTDMPFYDPRPTIGRLALADIPYVTKLDIFGRNMARILGLPT